MIICPAETPNKSDLTQELILVYLLRDMFQGLCFKVFEISGKDTGAIDLVSLHYPPPL